MASGKADKLTVDAAPLPGLALYYTDALQGVPHTFSQLVRGLVRLYTLDKCNTTAWCRLSD
jgi:hypothetical protein